MPTIGNEKVLRTPDPKISARGITKRAECALKALERSNKGKDSERTGVSARTLARINTK
jgi:hypothetical protein